MLGLSQIFGVGDVGKAEVVLTSLYCGNRLMGLAACFGRISWCILDSRVLTVSLIMRCGRRSYDRPSDPDDGDEKKTPPKHSASYDGPIAGRDDNKPGIVFCGHAVGTKSSSLKSIRLIHRGMGISRSHRLTIGRMRLGMNRPMTHSV